MEHNGVSKNNTAKKVIEINKGHLAIENGINTLADEERLEKGEKVHVIS